MLVECPTSNHTVAKRRFDSQCGSALLCPWERHLMMFPTLGHKQSTGCGYPAWRGHANRTTSALEWYDRHGT